MTGFVVPFDEEQITSTDPAQQYIISSGGVVPSRMFLGNSLIDLRSPVGAPISLVALNSPAFQVAQTLANASSLMTQSFGFEELAESWEVADTAYANVGTESVSVDVLWRTPAPGLPGAAGGITGKRKVGAPNEGREILLEITGALTVRAGDGTNSIITLDGYNSADPMAARYADGNWHWTCYRLNRSTDELQAATEHEPMVSVGLSTGSADTATRWRIGAVRGQAALVEVAIVIECEGAQCLVDDLCDRANRLSLETTNVFEITHRG